MLLSAERVIIDGHAYDDVGLDIDDYGRITAYGKMSEAGRKPDRMLKDKVLLPGFVNAHSHAFQRLLRGRTQVVGPAGEDNFWTWRQGMYWVAQSMDPDRMYRASRHAFLEMLLSGVTTVGEFHYLHHQPDGEPYEDPNAMAIAVVEAARDVGIRISLLHTLYLRGNFGRPVQSVQKRFADPNLDAFCDRFDHLVDHLLKYRDPRIGWGVAAHSLRAVPVESVVGLKVRLGHMPLHIHVSEQPAEVEACVEAHGAGPVELLARADVFDGWTTLVHATHLRPGEAQAIAQLGAWVCVCPSTEADLGDGLGPVGELFHHNTPLCLGTDGQTLPSILAEARRLEMHERLRSLRRNVLGKGEGDAVAQRLLQCATNAGAQALGMDAGKIAPGRWADFVTFDLDDPALAGSDDSTLLSSLIFSADNRAVRDVIVGGKFVVEDGQHPLLRASTRDFNKLADDIFADA